MDNPIRFVDPDGMDASDYGYGGSNVGAYDVTNGTLWSKNGETMWDGGGGGGDKGKNKKNGGTKEKDTKPKLTGLDASAAAAKSPNAADKVSTPPLIDPATLQKLKSGLQVMGYNGESGMEKTHWTFRLILISTQYIWIKMLCLQLTRHMVLEIEYLI